MDVVASAPRAVSASPIRQILALVPGVVLLGLIGYAGKLTEQSIAAYGRAHHLTLPNIEYVLWAIVFGLIVSNTIGVPAMCEAGVDTYELWLKIGIVLLGVRFLLGDIVKLGSVSLACVVIELILSIAVMTALGRWFRLSPKLTSLLAIGASICGVSAIIAAKGAIDADDDDVSYAIAAILALGAVSLLVFPFIGHALGMSDQAYGLWVGLAVDNTAEATAAGALYSETAGRFAVLAKTTRNATIGFVVLGYALYWVRKGGASEVAHKGAFLWQKPKFVLGFLLISAVATAGAFCDRNRPTSRTCRWAFLFTFAGIGLRTNIRVVTAGMASARRWRGRRVRDRRPYPGDGRGGRAVPRLSTSGPWPLPLPLLLPVPGLFRQVAGLVRSFQCGVDEIESRLRRPCVGTALPLTPRAESRRCSSMLPVPSNCARNVFAPDIFPVLHEGLSDLGQETQEQVDAARERRRSCAY
jgi:uncharacterized integral membrane protein (TIGR00698 family)